MAKMGMVEFLRDAFARADALELGKKTSQPDTEVGPDDKIVGELPDELKRLWAVLHEDTELLKAECVAHHKFTESIDLDGSRISDEVKVSLQGHQARHERHEVLSDAFWCAAKEAFPGMIPPKATVGLRKGWLFVIISSKRSALAIDLGEELSGLVAILSAGAGPRERAQG